MMDVSPKREPNSFGTNKWFGYYAGFSSQFVLEAVDYLGLENGQRLADPWNGSGTTTRVAQERNVACLGIDINPAIVLVARARLLGPGVRPSHRTICEAILEHALSRDYDEPDGEPLQVWFASPSASFLRAIELAIQHILVSDTETRTLAHAKTLSSVSSLAACFYVALFRAVRSFLGPFKTSNPTWIKRPKTRHSCVRPPVQRIADAFRAAVEQVFEDAVAYNTGAPSLCVADLGDSRSLSAEDESIDAVVTSPPYCTRIDYAAATRPELAVLGASDDVVRVLRNEMLGSTLVGEKRAHLVSWGRTCNSLLEQIRTHNSHASSTYYYNTHRQYFSGVFESFGEIARVLRPGGKCIAVVQDSQYKGIHNDLQKITEEMFEAHGMELLFKKDHRLAVTKAALNTRSLKYRADASATESVLVFAKS